VVRLRTVPLENGSRESIHLSAGVPDATGRPMMKAMPSRSADLSDGPRRPFQEHGAPVFGRIADTALRSAARTSLLHTTAPTHGHNPHRLPRGGAVLDHKGSREYYHSPVA
jgi:hypothetical protein